MKGRRAFVHQCATVCVIMTEPAATTEPAAKTTRVGIRELRQNLSVYVRRIRKGERFEVTDRGRPVGLLLPLPEELSPLERLIAEGRATRPVGNLLDLPPPEGEVSTEASEALIADREDRL